MHRCRECGTTVEGPCEAYEGCRVCLRKRIPDSYDSGGGRLYGTPEALAYVRRLEEEAARGRTLTTQILGEHVDPKTAYHEALDLVRADVPPEIRKVFRRACAHPPPRPANPEGLAWLASTLREAHRRSDGGPEWTGKIHSLTVDLVAVALYLERSPRA